MDMQSDPHEERWSRAVAAAEIVALALERDLPHMGLAAAREAARSALMELGTGPRRLAGPDLALLRELDAAPPQHMAGRPAERQAVVRAALAILDRLFLLPPSAAWREPARGTGAGHPSRRDPDHQPPWLRAASGWAASAPSELMARVGGRPA